MATICIKERGNARKIHIHIYLYMHRLTVSGKLHKKVVILVASKEELDGWGTQEQGAYHNILICTSWILNHLNVYLNILKNNSLL